jgi:predicted secreted acid phosphatase
MSIAAAILRSIAIPLLAALVGAAPVAAQNPTGTYRPVPAEASGYPNLGDIKRQLAHYHDSGRYAADQRATARVAERWLRERAARPGARAEKLAIVFDVDETVLSNYPAVRANDFGRVFPGPCADVQTGPCGIVAWTAAGRDAAIPATLALFRTARRLGVAVFFITGRAEWMRAGTEANLRRVGFDGWEKLILEQPGRTYASAADFKAPQRRAIERAGSRIILNIGDQPSDLAGGYAEKTFLMPNPFYRIP